MNYQELIEPYVNGLLSASELAEFEKQLAVDENLREEVDLFKMTEIVIDEAVKNEIAGQIKVMRSNRQIESSKPLVVRRIIYSLSVAASIALLIGFYFFQNPGVDSVGFAKNQYNNYQPNFSTFRGDNESDRIQNLLEEGKGAEVEKILKDQKPLDQYLLAHAFFLQGKYEEALSSFQSIASKTDSDANAADFYSALSLFALEREEEALTMLRGIGQDDNHTFKVLAIDVLKEWEK